jgi:hypothetical protein
MAKPFLTRSIWLALALASAWLAAAWLWMSWQPILADEWDFYRAIIHWPIQRELVPHPQGYVHFAQLLQTIFGPTIAAARLAGLLSALFSVWLLPALTAVFYPDRPERARLTVLAIALTALSPLVIQNTLLLDIDNTLLIPATLLILIAWAALNTHAPRRRVAVLSLLVAVALWVKLPTPPLLLAALGAYHLLRREWKRAGEMVLIGLAGLALFVITFQLYTLISGYQWAYFAPTFARSGSFFNLRDLLARFPQGLGVFVMWLTWPIAILLLIAMVQTARRIWRRQTTPADALALYVAVVAIVYPLIYLPAWGYPRYQAPIVPVALALVAATIAPHTLALSRRASGGLIALGTGWIILNLALLPDPLYPIYASTFEGGLYDLGTRLSSALRVAAAAAAPIGLVLAAGWWIAKRQQIDRQTVWINLLAALGLGSLLTLSLVQISAPYSTRYRYTYDYASYLWTVQAARAAGPDAYILAIKDTLNESGLDGEEIYPYLSAEHRPALLDVVQARRVAALIWTTKEDARAAGVTDNPQVLARLAECYEREQRGVFVVYRLKPGVLCR